MFPPLHHALAIVGLAILLVAPAFAQTPAPPDLSGTWKLNPAKSKVSKKTTLDPETVVIKCAGASVEIATSSKGTQTLEMFIADGKEHVDLNVPRAGQWTSKAEWKKSVLITEIVARVKGIDGGDFEIMHNTNRWTLSPDGRSLAEKVSTSLSDVPDQIFVYDKSESRAAPVPMLAPDH
jgi:hypothetical protein